ncbi:prolactin, isoform CRA_e [Rattus norvegicus]|uniref:Prolactin, isoform CRA_e n=1 Tax=Rattus norvegicus TaxID=10116 RepID=A6KLD1_RAT|nr:prolactin, isoform CRA_e [Rattus norvegicus]
MRSTWFGHNSHPCKELMKNPKTWLFITTFGACAGIPTRLTIISSS